MSGPCDVAAKTGSVADIFRKVRRFIREFPLVAVMLPSRAEIRAHEDELYGREGTTSRRQTTIVQADGAGCRVSPWPVERAGSRTLLALKSVKEWGAWTAPHVPPRDGGERPVACDGYCSGEKAAGIRILFSIVRRRSPPPGGG